MLVFEMALVCAKFGTISSPNRLMTFGLNMPVVSLIQAAKLSNALRFHYDGLPFA